MNLSTRRQFLRQLGLSAAALPFLPALPSLAQSAPGAKMQVLRALTSCGERVENIDLDPPGLQELYAHLVCAAEARA